MGTGALSGKTFQEITLGTIHGGKHHEECVPAVNGSWKGSGRQPLLLFRICGSKNVAISQDPEMKIYAVDTNQWTHESLRISLFHYYMFHGVMDPDRTQSKNQTYLIRNIYKIPAIFQVLSNLVISKTVQAQLLDVPNIHFREVTFSRLVDYPYDAEDFSPDPTTGYRKFQKSFEFLLSLPNISPPTELEPYFVLEAQSHAGLVKKYPDTKSLRCRMRRATTPKMKIRLSKTMVTDNPILWWNHHFFHEQVFARIEEFFNWDYFEKSDLRLD